MIAGAFSFSANYFFSYVLSPLKLDPRLSVKASGEGLEHRAKGVKFLAPSGDNFLETKAFNLQKTSFLKNNLFLKL